MDACAEPEPTEDFRECPLTKQLAEEREETCPGFTLALR